ncbi:SDR family NAD(P)-dependent oxidoreductase, partial [Kitasatospora sp. NPDC101155]|uniref:SDR family NAD(P)-dependent oxidoreductase n=1 Tax=Kitasatospora sp. NPDC101155 TaxID=3364097 RepID=UPI0037FB1E75
LAVDWSAVFAGQGARRVDLPTYAFQHQHYWLEEPANAAGNGAADAADSRFWAAVEQEDLAALAGTLRAEGADQQASLGSVLPVLSAWRRRRRDEAVVDRWRYRVSWQPLAATGTAAPSGTWLTVVPAGQGDDPWIGTLLDGLRGRGAETVVLEVSAADADRAVLAERLRAACGESAPAGVLSLAGLAEEPLPQAAGVSTGLAMTLALVQALGDTGIDAPLWCLTRQGVPVRRSDEAAGTVPAQLWGLGRVAALEHPQRWGGLVDLPESLDNRALDRLCGVLAGASGEDQVAIRSAGVFGRRLVRATPVGDTDAVRPWQPQGTVLLTGGTGGVGARVADWLARGGAEHLVLTSRRGQDAPGAAELADRLTSLGVRVTVAACDAADRDALAELIQCVEADGSPIRSVFHAAGVGDPTVLDKLSLTELAEVVSAKVVGAAHLDELFADRELDAFVLFSSGAGVWGGGSQGAYAAANAHLDALAEQRRSRGLTATSIAWGAWADGGMAGGEVGERLRRRGLYEMPPALALEAMQQALERDDTLLTVADIDWERFAPAFTAVRASRLLAELPEVQSALDGTGAADAGPQGSGSELVQRLLGMSEAEQQRVLLELVRSQAAAVLGHQGTDTVEPTRAFKELGFDSLTAVELRNRLNSATGVRLPATLVFDHPRPKALAEFLRAQLLGLGQDAAVVVPAGAGDNDDDPIAIVAMSCRYPGDVRMPEDLWQLVADGRDALGPFPTNRGWGDDLYDPDPEREGKSYADQGGFLTDVADFDAGFFGISPREALAMDPQQRLVLEASWELMERAGIDPETLRGSSTGVFVGTVNNDYGSLLALAPEGLEGHLSSGNSLSVLSGRVSYSFGLEGPAVTVDTGCSTSLVALHLAAQALRQRDCSMALVGGVTVMSTPLGFVEFSRQRGLAANGRCKSFAAAADGTGWGEGVGMLLVERLSDARRNGHPVLALVRGSAVNQDGASNGLTAPSGPSQQRVIRQALANARLTADQVDAVEAHGTGTTLGDPIEAQAIIATYGQDRDAERPLWLGALKSNIGHTQGAAGVGGVIKMVMAMRHGVLPKTLHVDEPTPQVDWSAGAVELLTEAREWPETGQPRRAGVSAFGMGGTNVHVILEQAPAEEPAEAAEASGDSVEDSAEGLVASSLPVVPWVVSGRSAAALAEQAERLVAFVEGSADLRDADVAYSLVSSRSALEHRGVVVAGDRDGALAGLRSLAAGEAAAGVL